VKAETTSRGHIPLLLRVLVTLAIFGAIIWLLPMGEVWKAMTSIGWWRWLAVLCVFGVGHVVSAYKWCQLVRAVGGPLDFTNALRAHMAGLFANIWLPSIVGGDVVRAAWISGQHGTAVPAVIGLLDRGIDLLALLLLIALGAILVGDSGAVQAGLFLRGAGVLLALGIPVGLIVLHRLKPEHLPSTVRRPGMKVISIARTIWSNPAPAFWSLLLAVIVQLAFTGLNYFIGTAMGIKVSFAVWLIAWPLAKVVALLPVSLGGLGVREAALAALLAPFAVTGTLAVAEALVWQSVLLGFGLLAGIALLLSGHRPFKPERS